MRSFRFWLTLVGSIIALASVLAIMSVWIGNLKFYLPASADKVARINTLVAASAYIAAIIAAIFALIAYWQASGLPSLKPEISFLPSIKYAWNGFSATFQPAPQWVSMSHEPFQPTQTERPVLMLDRTGSDDSDARLSVVLMNETKYTARNPGLRLSLMDCFLIVSLLGGPL